MLLNKLGNPLEKQVAYKSDLLPDAEPPTIRQGSMSPVELAQVKHQLDECLRKEWIRLSSSLYRPPFFLGKTDGTLLISIAYQALLVDKSFCYTTSPVKSLMQKIENTLDGLANAYCLSSIGSTSGYN